MQNLAPEYQYAEKIALQLEELFQIKIPEAEIIYIAMHLRGAKLWHEKNPLAESSDFMLAKQTKELIEEVGTIINKDLTDNHSLFEDLFTHLKTADYRLSQNMTINNPLLDRIKNEYTELFNIVKKSVEKIFTRYTVPDEEIGFLVMHFGAVLIEEKYALPPMKVASSVRAIGTSKMLVSRLKQEFPILKEVNHFSVYEFKKMDASEYDLVISTVPIFENGEEYITVNPLLSETDIQKISKYINERFTSSYEKEISEPVTNMPERRPDKEQLIGQLQTVEDFSKAIRSILQNFTVMDLDSWVDKRTALSKACLVLLEKMCITTIDEVVNTLLNRKSRWPWYSGNIHCFYHSRQNMF